MPYHPRPLGEAIRFNLLSTPDPTRLLGRVMRQRSKQDQLWLEDTLAPDLSVSDGSNVTNARAIGTSRSFLPGTEGNWY